MEQNKSNLMVIVITVIITAIVVGGGVYLWQQNSSVAKNQTGADQVEPLSFTIKDGSSVSVSKETAAFDYTVEQFKEMARDCGSKYSDGYFDQLVSKFNNATKTIYTFDYAGDSQVPSAYLVTVIPNRVGYSSLEEFQKDFNLCFAGGDAYPVALNDKWLLFKSSCGTGLSDESGRPVGCEKAREAVESTLKLN